MPQGLKPLTGGGVVLPGMNLRPTVPVCSVPGIAGDKSTAYRSGALYLR
jgi:hypothetical protein